MSERRDVPRNMTERGIVTTTDRGESADRVSRPSVLSLDEILGTPFPVLDDGFVRVIDYMGTDASIVQAARVSYGAGTKQVHEDRGLIRYLLRHWHTTPFEMCEIKLHVRVPMDAWRQWIRHRTASVNEYSTRYSVAIDAAQRTDPSQWRTQSTTNKQGSGEHIPLGVGVHLSGREAELHELSRTMYEERLGAGVAREQARKDLPLSTYTEAYWKIDLHNLFRFLQLRMDPLAQLEIREYARLIGHEIVARWVPLAWEAFLDYHVGGLRLSRAEVELIGAMLSGGTAAARSKAAEWGFIGQDGLASVPSRERAELEQKLARLSVGVPWESASRSDLSAM